MKFDHRLRVIANMVNLATPLGLLVGVIGGCQFRRLGHGLIAAEGYRHPFPIAGAFTVGNVVVIPNRTAAELEAAFPGVIDHEDAHAWQWSYCFGLPFLPLYVLSQGWSWLRTGHIASANFFEVQAGLASGRYPNLPKRSLRNGLKAAIHMVRKPRS